MGHTSASEPPTGNIVINEYKQSTKRLILKGELSGVVMKLVGKDENDILLVEIDSLEFNIDSPVIYEWSNKGGKTWRL